MSLDLERLSGCQRRPAPGALRTVPAPTRNRSTKRHARSSSDGRLPAAPNRRATLAPSSTSPAPGGVVLDPPRGRRGRGRLWRSRFAGTAISPPRSIRSAAGRPAIRRSCPRRTASPKRTCGRCRRRSSRDRSRDGAGSMWDVVERLRAIYCSTTGYDFAHIFVPEERQLAARGDRDRALPRAGRSDRSGRAARAADGRRSRSSASCTARSPARRASRSRGSTCSCRSSTR